MLICDIRFVSVKPLFEGVFCTTYVGFSGVFLFVSLRSDGGFVYDCLLQAFSIDRAIFGSSAVAEFRVLGISHFAVCAFVGKHLGIVCFDDGLHIGGAAVT